MDCQLSCLVIDDEPLALEQLARFISRIPSLRLVGKCLTVAEAERMLDREHIDLLFLDIEMPGTNGMEWARQLVAREGGNVPHIVFTTAYPDYAVDGFRVDAVDYLLKPLSFDELLVAVEKVERRRVQTEVQGSKQRGDTIFVRADHAMRRLHTADIVFVKGLSEYIQICVRGESRLLTTHLSMKHVESILPDTFLRIHKSFIVNSDYIETIAHEHVVAAGHTLPIGNKYRPNLRQSIEKGV
ncbi:MAG: response regulator transcription factor [Bacteroidaceae bacterium]|nr:response regulator transcription factor [Bacteroidaceae bacterium]